MSIDRDKVLAATTVCVGVSTGVFFAFSTFVTPALDAIGPSEAIAAMQEINAKAPNVLLGTVMFAPAVTLAWLGFEAWRGRKRSPRASVLAAAAAYLGGVIGVSVAGNFPLNDALARVDAHGAQAAREWQDFAASWVPLNHVRTISGLAATAALVFASRRVRSTATA